MSNPIDLNFLEILTSKVCHDLISPIGAVNNGVEFLEEMGPDAGEEITNLIAYSAQQASAKLQAFRLTYGAGGADDILKPEDAHKAIEAIVAPDGKIKQDWDAFSDIGNDDRPKGFIKVLTAGLLLAMEGLPKGGTIQVHASDDGATIIKAAGEDCGLKDEALPALNGSFSSQDLSPKFVHSAMTGLLARHYGFQVTPSASQDGSFDIKISC